MTRTLFIALVVSATANVAAAQPFPAPRVRPIAPVAPTPPVAQTPVTPLVAPTPPAPPAPLIAPDAFDWAIDIDPSVFTVDVDRLYADLSTAFAQQPFPAPPNPPNPPDWKGLTEESSYEQARSLIERDQYDRAVPAFDRVIERRGTRADAAMYWKAYSLSKLARTPEALTVLGDLEKQFASSPWVKDARALAVEVRQQAGQTVPADSSDDELKLLALRGLMQSDPDTGVPIIEKMLAGNGSVRVKDRALFVLSQSRSARARDVITGVARNASNPELRMRAVRYLGMRSEPESRQVLAQIARTEKDPELQRSAIRMLGMSNQPDAADSLKAIYTSDVPLETRKAVIDALAMHQNAAALVALARAEKNPQLKTEIVRRLSMMRSPEARDYMVELLK